MDMILMNKLKINSTNILIDHNHPRKCQISNASIQTSRISWNVKNNVNIFYILLEMRTTEAVPFVFSKSHKGTTREYLDNENIMTKMTNMPLAVDPIEDARKNMSRKPKIQPGSTKKYTANLEFLKKERE